MAASDAQYGKYHVTARLFNLLNGMSRDKQFILYKQLIKGNIATELLKLIIDMSEEQKIQLLEQLGDLPYDETPIRTIDLDESESFMRENPRKICLIPINLTVNADSFKGHIIDISTVGAFIETKDRFPVGQAVAMIFKLPNYANTFKVNGSIARSGRKGIGIKFTQLSKGQEAVIHAFIETKQ
jgi:Tfp pilus assembly protein PilZ